MMTILTCPWRKPARIFALLSLFVGLLCSAGVHSQEVYKTVDEDGKIIYSDKPQREDSVEVDVDLKNVQPPVDFRSPIKPQKSAEEKPVDYTVSIQNPAHESQIGPAQRSLSVSASVSPRLKRGHRLQFYFDGTPMNSAGNSLSASMPLGLKQRGKHQVSAAVLDSNGNVLGRSNAHSVWIIRP